MLTTRILDSGLHLIVETVPHLMTCSAGIWFNTGSRDESESENGVSHFLEHMFFKGTPTLSAKEIYSPIEDKGGWCNAWTSQDMTGFYVMSLPRDVEYCIGTLAKCLVDPAFRQEDIDPEKGAVVQEIDMYNDDPDSVLSYKFYETAFASDPLARSIIGTAENVMRFTREELFARVEDYYSNENATFVYVGPQTADEVAAFAEPLFSGLRSKAKRRPRRPRPLWPTEDVSKIFTVGNEQSRTILAYQSPAPGDALEHEITAGVMSLGCFMSSRLFEEIREKRGLAYSVNGLFMEHESVGGCVFKTGTSHATADEACSLMREIFETVKKDGLTDVEVERAKSSLSVSLAKRLESPTSLINNLVDEYCYTGAVMDTRERISVIEHITTDGVNSALAEVLSGPSVYVRTM